MDAPKWRFNGNYGDTDQVAEFVPEFLAVRDAIVIGGEYPYNNSFRGTIPGIAGPDEDRAIYLLQRLAQLSELDEKLAEYRANGYVPINRVDEPTRCEYNPPPNPAKLTDSRIAGYQAAHGDESWELDALPPDVLANLIRDAVEAEIDHDLWDEDEAEQEAERSVLRAVSARWDEVTATFGSNGDEE